MYCSLCVRRYKLYVENLNNETETELKPGIPWSVWGG